MANVKMAVLFGIVAIVLLVASYVVWLPIQSLTVLVVGLLTLGLLVAGLFVVTIVGWLFNPTTKKKN